MLRWPPSSSSASSPTPSAAPRSVHVVAMTNIFFERGTPDEVRGRRRLRLCAVIEYLHLCRHE